MEPWRARAPATKDGKSGTDVTMALSSPAARRSPEGDFAAAEVKCKSMPVSATAR
jgi:hypothetical protein